MSTFNSPGGLGSSGEAAYSGGAPSAAVIVAEEVPVIDRVRWASVIAGIFVTLSTLAVLSVLGSAVGFSIWSAWDRPDRIGAGVAIWGIIAALVAFWCGGCVAAWSAATHRRMDGLINGMLVWAVAIPLLSFGLFGAGAASANNSDRDNNAQAQANTSQIQRHVNGSAIIGNSGRPNQDFNQVYGNAENGNVSHRDVAKAGMIASWIALAALLLGLGSAAFGGYVGSREAREGVGGMPMA